MSVRWRLSARWRLLLDGLSASRACLLQWGEAECLLDKAGRRFVEGDVFEEAFFSRAVLDEDFVLFESTLPGVRFAEVFWI